MLNLVEDEKSFITSGPGYVQNCDDKELMTKTGMTSFYLRSNRAIVIVVIIKFDTFSQILLPTL